MILQLQNQMGSKVWSSWGVAKKNSELHSWRGLQKNHAQLQFKQGFPCKSQKRGDLKDFGFFCPNSILREFRKADKPRKAS